MQKQLAFILIFTSACLGMTFIKNDDQILYGMAKEGYTVYFGEIESTAVLDSFSRMNKVPIFKEQTGRALDKKAEIKSFRFDTTWLYQVKTYLTIIDGENLRSIVTVDTMGSQSIRYSKNLKCFVFEKKLKKTWSFAMEKTHWMLPEKYPIDKRPEWINDRVLKRLKLDSLGEQYFNEVLEK